jgi:hypothetical protein
MRRFIFILILLLLTVSCGMPSITKTVPPTLTTTHLMPDRTLTKSVTPSPATSKTLSPTLTVTRIPSSTLLPTKIYAQEAMIPELVSVCPENPFVPLNELGLDPQIRLVVKPYTTGEQDEIGYFILSPDMEKPVLTPNIVQPGTVNRGYNISPNGQWILFSRMKKDANNETPWISSLEGKQLWKLDSSGEMSGGTWLDDNSVLLFDKEVQPRKIINPFTKEEEILTGLPKMQVEGVGAKFFRYYGHTYLLYQSGKEVRLFDLINQSDYPVFQWLKEDAAPFLDTSIDYSNGRFLARVNRPYGFDISPEMNIEEIRSQVDYSKVMRQVIFPEQVLPISGLSPLSPNTPAFELAQWGGKDNLNKPQKFYWFDYSTTKYKDYCFEYNNALSNISSDGKFVAFTQYDLPSSLPIPTSIIIINLETGYRTKIEDFQFIGWVIEN